MMNYGPIIAVATGPAIAAIPTEFAFESGNMSAMAVVAYVCWQMARKYTAHLDAEATHRDAQRKAWDAEAEHRAAERSAWE